MSFGILTLIVACGLVGPLLSGATRLAVPVVVGEIAAGVLVGQTTLISGSSWRRVLSCMAVP